MPDQKAQKITIRNRKGTEGKLSHGAITEVLIDGKPVNGITFLKIEVKAKNMTKITMELLGDVEFEGLGKVVGKFDPVIYNPPKKQEKYSQVIELKDKSVKIPLPITSICINMMIKVISNVPNMGIVFEQEEINKVKYDYISLSYGSRLDSAVLKSDGKDWLIV